MPSLQSETLDRKQRLVRLAQAKADLRKREERALYEGSLSEFVRAAWPAIDNAQYQESWALDALCEHLEAVTRGHIKRLLINFPPRCGKSLITSIAWPAWVWAQPENSFVSGPSVGFLCGSYNHTLSLKFSNSSRRLLSSPFYRHYWGDRFSLMGDQNAKSQFDTNKGGTRIATSVGGSLIGIGGNVICVDDPHNTEGVESDAERDTALHWWKEISSTRLNDPKQSAIVVVMQRLHQSDVTGVICDGDDYSDWTHLMLPMRHVEKRHCVTVLKHDDTGKPEITWEDPRTGTELMWPERFGEKEVRALEGKLGPYMASGRLQQLPEPDKGGIIQREFWQLWDDNAFPHCIYKWASADTAYTEKESNDPTGVTCWGLFQDRGDMKIILMDAWRKRLEMHIKNKWTEDAMSVAERADRVKAWHRAAWAQHRASKKNGMTSPEPIIAPDKEPWLSYIDRGDNDADRWPNETYEMWAHRTQDQWGLCEWLAHTCRKFNVSTLLIEAKASGLSAAQEIKRLHGAEGWNTLVRTPEGDKTSRAYAVQGLFSSGLVYAPDREWAQMVIDEAAVFPKGTYRDLTDSMTQALSYVRDSGIFLRPEEHHLAEQIMAQYKPSSKPLYEV